MREFSTTLSEFTKGLRPDANMPRNSGFATELYNSRCGVAGLEVPPLIIYPISGAPVVNWPLPQLVKTKGLTTTQTDMFFLSSTNPQYLYTVGSDYSVTVVPSGSGATPLNLGVPSRYTIADFGWYQVWHKLAVPTNILYRYFDDDADTWYWAKYAGGGELPAYASMTCVCNFRGQLIVGLLSNASSVDGTKSYVVAWSRIGQVNLGMMLKASGSYLDIDDDGVGGTYKRTFGNYRVGPNSVIHRVLPLGNGVMVYCSDRIFYMKAVSAPEPTFGIVPVASFGMPGTWCVEGDEHEHVIVDSSGDIWRVKEGPKLERLGYKEFINQLTRSNIVITFNPIKGDYYFSDGVHTFLLSPYGFSKVNQCPTSLILEDVNSRVIGPISSAATEAGSDAGSSFMGAITNERAAGVGIGIDPTLFATGTYYEYPNDPILRFFKSANKGVTWSDLELTGQTEYVRGMTSVASPNKDTIFAVYVDENELNLRVATSVNGGTSFTTQTVDGPSVDGENVYWNTAIKVLDTNNIFIAYAVDPSGAVERIKFAKSIDGGANWTLSTIGNIDTFFGTISIEVVNPKLCFVGYYDADEADMKVAKSIDGGTTWTSTTIDATAAGYYNKIKSLNGNEVFLVYHKSSGKVCFAKSSDGGSTWKTSEIVDSAGSVYFPDMAVVDSKTIYVVYGDSIGGIEYLKLAKSADGGENWTISTIKSGAAYLGSGSYGIALRATSIDNLYILCRSTTGAAYIFELAKSVDGGSSWSFVTVYECTVGNEVYRPTLTFSY